MKKKFIVFGVRDDMWAVVIDKLNSQIVIGGLASAQTNMELFAYDVLGLSEINLDKIKDSGSRMIYYWNIKGGSEIAQYYIDKVKNCDLVICSDVRNLGRLMR